LITNWKQTMSVNKVLIDGEWRSASLEGVFSPFAPVEGKKISEEYPVSNWKDCDDALDSATLAYAELTKVSRHTIARFLECYADKILENAEKLVELAHIETGLAKSPR